MDKTTYRVLTLSLAGTLLCGISLAQQTSAPTANPPAASTTPAKPKSQTTTSGTTAAKKTATPLVLKTQKEKASYAIGMNLGNGLKENMKKSDVDINTDILLRGFKDALNGSKPLLTDAEAQSVMSVFQTDLNKHVKEMHDAAAAKNSSEGAAFLAANKAKPGVVTLPSGLQYKIITEGAGPKPTASDTIVCNYKGSLIDGTEFDSSFKRGQPATIPVGRVIKGWTEAMQLMPVGSKWQLFIPPSLAYGEAGTNGGPIGPNATLIFEVELLSIQPKPEPKPAPGAAPAAGTAAPDAQQKPKPEAGAPAAATTPPPASTPAPTKPQ